MSLRDFTLPKAQQDFGLTADTSQQLFAGVAPVPLSETLRRYLDDFQPLCMSIPTEKGRSELLVAPLLAEVWRRSEHRISTPSPWGTSSSGTGDASPPHSSNFFFQNRSPKSTS
jgi:hypothetical protein